MRGIPALAGGGRGMGGEVVEAQFSLKKLKICKMDLPFFIEVCTFRMRRFNLYKIFASDSWAEMNWA